MITLAGLLFSSYLTSCIISARSHELNPVDTNESQHAPGIVGEVAGVLTGFCLADLSEGVAG